MVGFSRNDASTKLGSESLSNVSESAMVPGSQEEVIDVGVNYAYEIFYILNRLLSSIMCKVDNHSGLKTWLSE